MSLELSKKAAAVKPSSTLAITAKAKELKAQGKDVVGFGAGEPDFNTPENICEAAIKAIKDGFTKYTPASGTNELKAAISKKFKEFNGLDYDTDQIVISNGGKHSLTNIFTALINPGDEVIIPAPFWLSYPEIVKLAGGVPVIVTTTKEQNFKLTAEDLAAAVTDKTKALVLNTPNNPTGMLYTEEELRAIAKVAVEKDFYVVADEMYEMLVYGEQKHISIASLGKDIYDRTITCSGLAKSYAMTGWRIGYTGSSKEIAKMMEITPEVFTFNGILEVCPPTIFLPCIFLAYCTGILRTPSFKMITSTTMAIIIAKMITTARIAVAGAFPNTNCSNRLLRS